ncbi:hypothetical protein BV25DRAFT_1812409 [Artomyces pyxidatus]|uniref:Uncharacterized protein n=1 Tax=Artomyces pyxidatus TaxID=48021 RepID=A0ACB8SN96_9AGAM|nr:hypothetical protein BV25DRAFT_1812409 [Artomyces pyxidatus]
MDAEESQGVANRLDDEAPLWRKPVVVPFGGQAGAPIPGQNVASSYAQYDSAVGAAGHDNPYHPFASKIDWELGQWAKTRGPGSNAFTDLLDIDEIPELLGINYKNTKELNAIIDHQLPPRPVFKRHEVEVDGEKFDFYLRDTLECIQSLYGAPDLASVMINAPERHYADADMTLRVYSDMHTSRWWWKVQEQFERGTGRAARPGATIIPVIISSDKTQLTLFRNKAAYPIYLTIGNLPKDIRRKPSRHGQILLGYLPVTRLDHITNDDTRRRALSNLFHACMSKAMDPLKIAGIEGVKMATGDGMVRRCHPILAAFVGDYPEQVLVAGVKTGLCPQGVLEKDLMGENVPCEKRDLDAILDALDKLDEGPLAYVAACEDVGIKPIYRPFWQDLPYVNIFQSITPDILHQLYQGVVKHLVGWIRKAYGDDIIDARFRCLPPNHNLRHFAKGISHLSRVSGAEHQDICRALLGAIIDLPLPDGAGSPIRLVRAVRALLDFVYLAQYPSHTADTLEHLQDALDRFHANKSIFIDLGIRNDFNFPKMHTLTHYVESVALFGTADNFNTSYSERLHIDFTKDAYRASNRKDEYPQMTLWLRRREQIYQHALVVEWRLAGRPAVSIIPPDATPKRHIHIARFPNIKAVSFGNLAERYGATRFESALATFIVQKIHPGFTAHQVAAIAATFHFPFNSVAVYHKMKFWNKDILGPKNAPETLDSVHARASYRNSKGQAVAGRFDTALVNEAGLGEVVGVQAGHRVAQVRVIFSLSQRALDAVFPGDPNPPRRLAYIEWFSRFPRLPDAHHRMYRIKRSRNRDLERVAAVVPVDAIRRSVHLFPKFGPGVPEGWTSSNVLELCETFFVSSFTDRHTYITVI